MIYDRMFDDCGASAIMLIRHLIVYDAAVTWPCLAVDSVDVVAMCWVYLAGIADCAG